jgi:hypothetical protein
MLTHVHAFDSGGQKVFIASVPAGHDLIHFARIATRDVNNLETRSQATTTRTDRSASVKPRRNNKETSRAKSEV